MSIALKSFKGVLCGSVALADFLRKVALHHLIREFHPVLDLVKLEELRHVAPADPNPSQLRIGFVGGKFRAPDLHNAVVPAICSLTREFSIEFYSRSGIDELSDAPIPLTTLSFSKSLDEFLKKWRALDLHLLVHPKGKTGNIKYKNANILLIALYLGAIPILADEEAYRGLGEEHGVLKVNGSTRGWEAAIRRAGNADFRTLLLQRLEYYCRNEFKAAHNLAVLAEIASDVGSTDILTWGDRVRETSLANTFTAVRAAWMEEQLRSRSYNLVLKLRNVVNLVRRWVLDKVRRFIKLHS